MRVLSLATALVVATSTLLAAACSDSGVTAPTRRAAPSGSMLDLLGVQGNGTTTA